MSDLTTHYLGLKLKSPLVASASPICESVQNIRQLEDAGIGAVVLPSLFEEQIEVESCALVVKCMMAGARVAMMTSALLSSSF